MSGILPGGVLPFHRLIDDNKDHYSQLLLKRCLHDRNPLLPKMEDKYKAREVVEEKKSGNLPKLYHWSDQTHKIPWNKLPLRCVIKTNHWSGDALFIMDNGEEPIAGIERKLNPFSRTINRYRVIRNGRDQNGGFWPRWRIERKLKSCLKQDFPVPLEWGASSISPRGIMVEELLLDKGEIPADWKVHVFHGKAGFIQYDIGRMKDHSQAIYDLKGNKIPQTNPPWPQANMPDEIISILGQKKLDELIEISQKLAEDIDYSRVDFFLSDDKWVFGEFTNYHNSCQPQSDEWEVLAGNLWLKRPLEEN
jgi:hypothetical protein